MNFSTWQVMKRLLYFLPIFVYPNSTAMALPKSAHNCSAMMSPGYSSPKQLIMSSSVGRVEKLKLYATQCEQLAVTENGKIPKKSASALRIATYNVHFWKDPLHSKGNFAEIITVLKAINADVIILQEMNIAGSRFLSRATILDSFKALGYHYGYDSFGFKFNTRDRVPCGEIILSKLPIAECSVRPGVKGRYHGYSRIELHIGGKKIAIYGTHPNVSNVEQRVREIENLVSDVSNDDADYIVLGADWNAVRRADYSAEVWAILENMYKTALRLDAVPTHELELIEKAGFIDSFTAARFTKPQWTVWNGTMVDFIFVKAKTGKMPVAGSYLYYTQASDHIPVIMDIAVPPARL